MGADPNQPHVNTQFSVIVKALREQYPKLVEALTSQTKPIAESNVKTQESIAPREQALSSSLYNKYSPEYAKTGAENDLNSITGAGGKSVVAANDVNKVISDMIFKTTKKYSRNNKLTFNDTILYLFNYCSINKTKLNVVSNLNYNNDINVHPSNYQKKEAKIPLLFYENLFNNIQSLFYEKYSINDLNKNRIVCVDGTYNNTNLLNNGSLETSLLENLIHLQKLNQQWYLM